MNHTINVGGRLMNLSRPQVMGILNVTPDSFYAGSRKQTDSEIAERTNQIIEEGASMIDVGAFSTRPGAPEVSEEEEMARLRHGLAILRRQQPDAVVSVDTFRPDVARMAVEEYGAAIINDVSEGGITGVVDTPMADADLAYEEGKYPPIFRMVAQLKVPYILMSVQPTLKKMLLGFAREVQQLRDLGVKDIILDPGFGFGKTIDENYALLHHLDKLSVLDLPILVGVSRKRMIYNLSCSDADHALNGTTVVNTIAAMKGASVLRVHDVKEAVEVCRIVAITQRSQSV